MPAYLGLGGALLFLVRPADLVRSDFFRSFESSLGDQGGGPITEHALGGAPARGGPTQGGYALGFIHENAAITVIGGNQETAELIAELLLDEMERES